VHHNTFQIDNLTQIVNDFQIKFMASNSKLS